MELNLQTHDAIDEFFKKEIAKYSIKNDMARNEPYIYERFTETRIMNVYGGSNLYK